MADRPHTELDKDRGPLTATTSLAERLDPAIGDTSTVMGAMLTELLRRTLRGGVTRIGEELDGYVAEKVDETLVERRPVIEQMATDVADHTARSTATEVAVEEVRNLESRTKEADTVLERQIQEAAARVSESARNELMQQVETFLERSKKGTAVLNTRLKGMEDALESLHKNLSEEQVARQGGVAEVEKRTGQLLQHLESEKKGRNVALDSLRNDLLRVAEDSRQTLLATIDLLKERNRDLEARVEELERPRGLRGLFARLFGRKKKKKSRPSDDAAAGEPEEFVEAVEGPAD